MLNKKAQATLEVAVLIAVIAAALIGMTIYLKRGLQGKMRESIDSIGEQYSLTNTTAETVTGTVTQERKDTYLYTQNTLPGPFQSTLTEQTNTLDNTVRTGYEEMPDEKSEPLF